MNRKETNMKLFLKTIFILSLTLGISSAVSAKTYKMAVTDIEGMDALISEWGPFKEALELSLIHI